jgi:hypothetical protein
VAEGEGEEPVSYYLKYARDFVGLAEQCLRHGVIGREDAAKWVDDALQHLRSVHRDLELAIEELVDFRKRILEAEKHG